MKKNTKKIATVTMTGAVLLAAPIAMNAAPMLSAQTVEAAVKTGWVKESGKWYFYKDGVKATGWQEWDGKRYYLNADGTMKANEWMIDADGSIYYFRSWGGAYKSCNVVINGRSYTFGADSKMQGSQWIVKGGKWYLAKDGKLATGWQEWQGSKYYLNSDGTMRSNEWRLDDSRKIRYLCSWGGAYKNRSANINGRSYTFNSNADVTNTQWIAMDGTWKLAKDGRIATGWQTWDKNLYYLNSDGTMKANEAFTDGGKLYFFRSWGGAYKNCWYTSNGKKYYLHDNSAAYQNEWLKADGKWYYFQSDSTMATDTWIDNYYVDASGVWIPSKEKPTDKWITSGNRKWYRHADGSYTKNDWELINGKYYRFDNDGWMVTGWKKINDTWYYMDKTTGERYGEGWHWIDGNCYYMNANGEMAADTWIDGYYVDASGKWIKDPKNEEHTHKWVEETKTLHHDEEFHFKTIHHDAVTHEIFHPESTHIETVVHPEESHMETVHHEEVGHTVHHEAEGYYNTVHHDAVTHTEIRNVCRRCGAVFENTPEAIDAHELYHINKGESISYYQKEVEIEDQPAYDEQVWVETKAAWDEWVVDQEAWDEQVKVVDKAAWSEQVKVVDKEAWTETVVDKEAYDEKIKVIDKAAYDETIKQKVCSICGKIQK